MDLLSFVGGVGDAPRRSSDRSFVSVEGILIKNLVKLKPASSSLKIILRRSLTKIFNVIKVAPHRNNLIFASRINFSLFIFAQTRPDLIRSGDSRASILIDSVNITQMRVVTDLRCSDRPDDVALELAFAVGWREVQNQ